MRIAPPLTPVQQHDEEREPTYCAHTRMCTLPAFTTQIDTIQKLYVYTHTSYATQTLSPICIHTITLTF